MPKNHKKPLKKAVSRPANAKTRSSSRSAPAARKANNRSVAAATSSKPSAQRAVKAKLNTKAKPNPKLERAAPRAVIARKPVPKRPSARLSRARSTILPPKPSRKRASSAEGAGIAKVVRIAPLPPRTPRVVSDEPRQQEPARNEPKAKPPATVVSLRQPVARTSRPVVTPGTWREIEALAARLQRGALSDQQRAAICAGLEGKDSLVVIPDDVQAVASYQLCAALLSEPTVVLSPVLAELQAQTAALAEQRRPVLWLSPDISGPERSAALGRIARGGPLLVLLGPEALSAADVHKALTKSGIGLFVVEEAHCASDLSHELRPSYTELGQALSAFGKPPVMALTRVATSQVQQDIAARLSLRDPVIVRAPAVRENLRLVTCVARGEQRQAALVRLIERLEPPGLIFCASPHDADSVYSALVNESAQGRARICAHRYHSGMSPGDRAAELLAFTLPGARGVMVAVSAFAPGCGLPGLGDQANAAAIGFGRGAGKRDLRFVVHYQSPASIEQYLREIQRAGRDGLSATCVLFHESSHRSLHEVMLAQQRFRATHLAELGRALEAPALEGRTVTLESLALATGQSRRTTDRLTALLADAGVVSKTGGWVRVSSTAAELDEACRALGAKLYALREQDGHRLSAVAAFAESGDCKLGYLSRYLGQSYAEACGQCSTCSSELSATESIPPQAAARRPMVQEFWVKPGAALEAGLPEAAAASVAGAAAGAGPLTAKLADFGSPMPRAGR